MKPRLSEQVAIVTGAGKGSGETVAKRLGGAGVRVAVNDINPDRAERVAADIRAGGGLATAITSDISNKFQCVDLVETTRLEWGRLDILVNNAHVQPAASVLKMDEWDWERCFSVNLKGLFFMSQLCGRVMADENGQRGGIIVNITSGAGNSGKMAYQAAFHASMAGVVGFTRECAREFARYGIQVYSVVRGQTDSGNEEHEGPYLGLEIGGRSGKLDKWLDVADTVLLLCV